MKINSGRVWFWHPRTGVIYRPKHKSKSRGRFLDFYWNTQVSIIENKEFCYTGSFKVQKNGKCKIITDNLQFKDHPLENHKELIIIPKSKAKFKKYYHEEVVDKWEWSEVRKNWHYRLEFKNKDIITRQILI